VLLRRIVGLTPVFGDDQASVRCAVTNLLPLFKPKLVMSEVWKQPESAQFFVNFVFFL